MSLQPPYSDDLLTTDEKNSIKNASLSARIISNVYVFVVGSLTYERASLSKINTLVSNPFEFPSSYSGILVRSSLSPTSDNPEEKLRNTYIGIVEFDVSNASDLENLIVFQADPAFTSILIFDTPNGAYLGNSVLKTSSTSGKYKIEIIARRNFLLSNNSDLIYCMWHNFTDPPSSVTFAEKDIQILRANTISWDSATTNGFTLNVKKEILNYTEPDPTERPGYFAVQAFEALNLNTLLKGMHSPIFSIISSNTDCIPSQSYVLSDFQEDDSDVVMIQLNVPDDHSKISDIQLTFTLQQVDVHSYSFWS